MITITDILEDVDRGILANNMLEDKFSYRIIFFVNEGAGSVKRYIDTPYSDLRRSLENIIRGNLSLTNRVGKMRPPAKQAVFVQPGWIFQADQRENRRTQQKRKACI